jgi:TRAP-type uncharacterized transport system substrate-binding protein
MKLGNSVWPKIALITALLAGLATAFLVVDQRPDKSHLAANVLTGDSAGNYAALGAKLSRMATAEGGNVQVAFSAGSVDNLRRLQEARKDCRHHYGLVQEGIPIPKSAKLKVLARLRKSESLVMLVRSGRSLQEFAELQGLRVGIGEQGSGSDYLMRQLFERGPLAKLQLKLENHTLQQQLDAVRDGSLDIAAMLIDEDAELLSNAVLSQPLELLALKHLDVVARRYPFLWHGRIGAGQYDPIRKIPKHDVRVLRADTLVMSNGCASHSQQVAMLSLLHDMFPGLIEYNRKRGAGALSLSSSSKSFFDNQGPDWTERHLPWLVDVVPPSRWLFLATAISVLFNLMGLGHRFRLWRLDVHRVALESELRQILGAELTDEEIHDLEPKPRHFEAGVSETLEALLKRFTRLIERCRSQSTSMLVPMGQEMAYRYQEDAMAEAITGLRLLLSRLQAGPPPPEALASDEDDKAAGAPAQNEQPESTAEPTSA